MFDRVLLLTGDGVNRLFCSKLILLAQVAWLILVPRLPCLICCSRCFVIFVFLRSLTLNV